MAKKGGTKRGKSRGLGLMSEDDERESLCSETSFLSNDDPSSGAGDSYTGSNVNGGSITLEFNEIMDKISERRTSTREEGLRDLIGALRSYAIPDSIRANQETLLSTILGLIRKGGEVEAVLSAEALTVFFVVLGPDADEIFSQVIVPLEFAITRNRYEDVRIESVNALAMGAFICCTEDEKSLGCLRFLDEVFSGGSEGHPASEELKASAIDAWALLASVAPKSYHQHQVRARLLSTFYEFLDSPSAALKLAAGEALAFLNEYWQENKDFEYPEEEVELLDNIIERLQELAREGSKKMSRREKKQQRSSFRDVYAAVAENEAPHEVLSFRTKSFRLTSWAKVKQLEALRDCLQGGFLCSFAKNPVIHEIFDIAPEVFEGVEERSVIDKNSELGKYRTQTRTRNRKSRENAKSLFLDADGEDDAR